MLSDRRRRWEQMYDEDPATGLLNLFDVWIAFAVALLLATVGYFTATSTPRDAGPAPLNGKKMEHYRPTAEKLTGRGERLGTAYRLSTGEVVYVPDEAQPRALP